MITIYFNIVDGYLDGWSTSPSNLESEQSAVVEKGHEVLQVPEVFKFVDGELIKDEERQQQLIEDFQETPSENEELRKENEKLREEIDMNALAFMEFAEIILGGGSE